MKRRCWTLTCRDEQRNTRPAVETLATSAREERLPETAGGGAGDPLAAYGPSHGRQTDPSPDGTFQVLKKCKRRAAQHMSGLPVGPRRLVARFPGSDGRTAFRDHTLQNRDSLGPGECGLGPELAKPVTYLSSALWGSHPPPKLV
ncbi:hypothetical protein NDU88_005920 [Pleurodeles waltl]|uniref:Uncharacterized protein n=1 Tax=Pleurodeles waltl TaxID=8319 RepID=A0AAV7SN21_PLEWA|nr:hypothetical protein NDU88_005920 [Pleurodeles waltl]